MNVDIKYINYLQKTSFPGHNIPEPVAAALLVAGLHDPGEVAEELLRHCLVLLSRAVADVVVKMLRGLQTILIVHRQDSISILSVNYSDLEEQEIVGEARGPEAADTVDTRHPRPAQLQGAGEGHHVGHLTVDKDR